MTPECPYPVAGGGPLRSASMFEYLARRYAVDVFAFREPGASDPRCAFPQGLARDVEVANLDFHSRRTAARAFRNAVRLARRTPPLVDRFAGFDTVLAEFLRGKRYRLGIVEHFWCAPYAAALADHCDTLLLNLHNVESELHASCARAAGVPESWAHHVFRDACLRLEKKWLPRFAGVLVASENDAARVAAIAGGARTIVYPNAIPLLPLPLPPEAEQPILVFSGNLEYHPNQSAVRWFHREIWPLLRGSNPKLIWRLIGKNPHAVSRELAGGDRIDLAGPIDDAVSAIAAGSVAVVPVLSGSGTRIKILEAWAAGVPVVSTTIGAEGLGAIAGNHLLIADTPAAFAAAVKQLLTSPELRRTIANAARLRYEQNHTWPVVWSGLDQALRNFFPP